MLIKYQYNGELLTLNQLRRAFTHISFPAMPTQSDLTPLGVTIVDVTPEVITPTLEELKTRKAQEIRDWANRKKYEMQSGYSDLEITTFDQQKAGADDILSGTTDSDNALFVSDLLAVRLSATPTTEQLTDFANLIISNWTAARNATVQIAGTQQRLELALRAVTTQAEYEAAASAVDAVIYLTEG